ncbi:hypothetical protein K6119_07825 [Paracrocinitomix mangrovi]|uniref:hypothetical protein n=1 Tax=Paracrocinitomix mangrovi TaxID=2862509 RepID=UPI001EDB02E7|nr:hypothetical protein [Paracrocinitomix mangrovi]UKN03422.1 hypothetical protein K6119_07825 [Paracrocinitomix mangrovi]
MSDNQSVHSSVKPIINSAPLNLTDKKDLAFKRSFIITSSATVDSSKLYNFRLYPLVDINGGIELGQNSIPKITAGAGFGLNYSKRKFYLTFKMLPYYKIDGVLGDSIQSNYNMDFGTNRAIANNIFYRGEFLMAYRPNRFFTFLGGYGKNFFGEGYRSMLLSDNIGAHPFFKIETSFGSIKYVNLYNFWRDNSTDPFDRSQDIPKFNATHYLSWNIIQGLNLSVFETVNFRTKDTLVNRGFDFNYINPVVFYRPVEYGLGSADNVLLGMNASYKLNRHHNIYTQFILDEFLLSEIQAQSRWWANKYAWQLGYKSDEFFKENLYFQIELNGARPFTYSHKSSAHAYGHMNAAAAHPLGANFMELLQITSYSFGDHRITNKITFASFGTDIDSLTSYGQDIFKSYSNRPGDFDQMMYQGNRNNVLNETFIYEYALIPSIDMYLTAAYNLRVANNEYNTKIYNSFQIGIRSRIWNVYNDF